MSRIRALVARGLVALLVPALTLAIARHYQAGDPAIAFPGGQIRIAIDASQAPFAFIENGELQGLEVDIARALGREIGLPLQLVNMGYYELYDALQSGQVQLLIAALRRDPARTDWVRYSRGYFDNGYRILMPAGTMATQPVKTELDIAFEYASAADMIMRSWQGDGSPSQAMPYELPEYALDALRLGHADAALVDAVTLRSYARKHPGWAFTSRQVSSDVYRVALSRVPPDTWKLVESALSRLKHSGELARIVDAWL